jgi:hypothetical protein
MMTWLRKTLHGDNIAQQLFLFVTLKLAIPIFTTLVLP